MKWQSAQIDGKSKTDFVGHMNSVTGSLYKGGKKICDYKADGGFADKSQNVLKLKGNVQMKSLDPDATLTCEEVEFLAGEDLIKAKGNVNVVGSLGAMDTDGELWASSDLRRVATPSMFKKQ